MRKIAKRLSVLMNCCVMTVLLLTVYMQKQLPDRYSVVAGEEISFSAGYPIQMVQTSGTEEIPIEKCVGDSYQMDLKLLGTIPVKTVEVNVVDRKMVTVSGAPFGIKMFTDGLMVVGMSDIPTTDRRVNPATNEQLAELMQQNGGAPIRVEVKRGNSLFFSTLQPVLSSGDGQYRLGVWVRDSSAGIGTMTYLDQNSGLFTGLGHAVCDVDTGELMPLSNGEAVPARITGCKKGEAGTPGELKGKFTEEPALGSLSANTTSGVYGLLRSRTLYTGEELPLAMKHEVHTGAAYIYTTVEGTQPQRYEIEIEKLMMNEEEKGQNMVIHVVDPALLAATGGIVQGMWVRYNRGNTGNA